MKYRSLFVLLVVALAAAACLTEPTKVGEYCDLILGRARTATICKNESLQYKCASYHYNSDSDLCEGERCRLCPVD